MKHTVKATPESELNNVALADQIWSEACEHCANNIDAQCISTGVNAKQNLFYGRYYIRFSTDSILRSPLPIISQQYFVDKDVYFVRSTDLPSANKMPFFMICICFVKDGDSITTNGTYSRVVGGHPSICVFVQMHIKYMTNFKLVSDGFRKLSNLFYEKRSTFVHEFTHMLDDQKYDIGKNHKSNKGIHTYVNLNHEVNARYMQVVHSIVDRLSQIGILDEIHKHFPTFNEFYAHYWTKQSGVIPEAFWEYLSPSNKKRLRVRLYGFYRFLVESEMKNKVNSVDALQFAQQQIIAD